MKKLIFLLSITVLLSLNVRTTADEINFLTGMLVGSAVSSTPSKDVIVPAQQNAIMIRLSAYLFYDLKRAYNLNNGKVRLLVRESRGCERGTFEEITIAEFLSREYPGYKGYSIQPGRNEVFIFVIM
jgi:hypothetical protein